MDPNNIEQLSQGLESARQQALGIQESVANLPGATTSSTGADLVEAATSRLGGQVGAVSSTTTRLEDTLKSAFEAAETGRAGTETVIEESFKRQIGEAREAGAEQVTAVRESQRGFATSAAGLDKLKRDNQKRVADLESRRVEALAMGNTQYAAQIQDLEFKSLEFELNAEQQTFSNLLGVGQFGLEQQREARLQTEIDAGSTQIVGSPSTGIYAVRKNADGTTSLESLLAATGGTTGGFEDDFLSLAQVQTLVDRGAQFTDPITSDQRDFEIGDRMSDVRSNVGQKRITPNVSELRAAAMDTASQFTDLIGGWGVPQGQDEFSTSIRTAVENTFGQGTKKISDDEFQIFLGTDTGLSSTELESIVDLME